MRIQTCMYLYYLSFNNKHERTQQSRVASATPSRFRAKYNIKIIVLPTKLYSFIFIIRYSYIVIN